MNPVTQFQKNDIKPTDWNDRLSSAEQDRQTAKMDRNQELLKALIIAEHKTLLSYKKLSRITASSSLRNELLFFAGYAYLNRDKLLHILEGNTALAMFKENLTDDEDAQDYNQHFTALIDSTLIRIEIKKLLYQDYFQHNSNSDLSAAKIHRQLYLEHKFFKKYRVMNPSRNLV